MYHNVCAALEGSYSVALICDIAVMGLRVQLHQKHRSYHCYRGIIWILNEYWGKVNGI